MRLFPRLRLLLARRPWMYWSAVCVLALLIGASAASTLAGVDTQRRSWGQTAQVVVANAPITTGMALNPLVRTTAMPIAMVPASAVRELPPGAIALQRIAAGEIVVTGDISLAGGPAALLPVGWLAITVETPDTGLFQLGDHLVVFAFGQVVADSAVVVSVGENIVMIGVANEVAPRVADAANQHLAILALSASPPPPPTAP